MDYCYGDWLSIHAMGEVMTDWSKLIPPSQSETHTIIYSGPNLFPEINHVELRVDIGKYQNKDMEDVMTNWDKLVPPANDAVFTVANVQRAKEWLTHNDDATPYIALKEYNNKVPTHDPYTNPDVYIYYQCACGAILDPSTKSFAALNNAAMNSGWKVRWGSESYVPYCVKCGEDVE